MKANYRNKLKKYIFVRQEYGSDSPDDVKFSDNLEDFRNFCHYYMVWPDGTSLITDEEWKKIKADIEAANTGLPDDCWALEDNDTSYYVCFNRKWG